MPALLAGRERRAGHRAIHVEAAVAEEIQAMRNRAERRGARERVGAGLAQQVDLKARLAEQRRDQLEDLSGAAARIDEGAARTGRGPRCSPCAAQLNENA